MQDNNSERKIWIDSIKGFAIALVVIGHIMISFSYAEDMDDYSYILLFARDLIYMFHMPLFFMISGMTFFLAYIEHMDKRRYLRQTLNLVLIYFIWSILFGLSKVALNKYVAVKTTFGDVLAIWRKPIGPYWYLYVLIIFYIAFRWIRLEYRKTLFWGMLLLSILGGFGIRYFSVDGIQIGNILYYAFFFYLGELYICNRDSFVFSRISVVVLVIIAMTTAILFWRDKMPIDEIPIVMNCVAIGVSISFIKLFDLIGQKTSSKILSFLGRHSLSIYIIHPFITTGNRTILLKLGIQNIWICIIVSIAMGISIPLLFEEISKRIGIYELLFRPVNDFFVLCEKTKMKISSR